MKLGVCYYPEHWPDTRWGQDAREMRAAGLSLVRIAEFAWSQIEPAENQFNWSWLDRAIETLAGEGLEIVLCTPTAAPPAWLVSAHPDVLPVNAQGQRMRFGSRRHYCANNHWIKERSQQIVSAMAQRYGEHQAVSAWQIDNEFSCYDTARCYCPVCAAAFQHWLQVKYKNLDELNDAWGTAFWSQTYTGWEQIEPPNLLVAHPNPSHYQDYTRFSSNSVTAFQQIQIDVLRKYAPTHTLTTNFLEDFAGLDYYQMASSLDFSSCSSYPTGHREMNAGILYGSDDRRVNFAYDVGDPYVTAMYHDLTRGLKGEPFWIMEQQAGQINWSLYNSGVRPGNLRLWTWHAITADAEAVLYFRWRASRFGHEQHHSGLLKHDGTPDVGYLELQAMLAEHDLLKEICAQPFQAQVAILFDFDDMWALERQPHHQDFGYLSHLFVFYRALQALGIPVDIRPRVADLSAYKLVVAHTSWLADERFAARLSNYVEKGGTLSLGVRSGFKTPSNLVTEEPLPGPFRSLVSARVADWHALSPGIGYDFKSEIPNLSGTAHIWAERLQPQTQNGVGADVHTLARYTSGPFDGHAALTQRKLGQGDALYLGWHPSLEQATALLAHLSHKAGIERLAELPPGMIALQRGDYILLFNFCDEPLEADVAGVQVQVPARDLKMIS